MYVMRWPFRPIPEAAQAALSLDPFSGARSCQQAGMAGECRPPAAAVHIMYFGFHQVMGSLERLASMACAHIMSFILPSVALCHADQRLGILLAA